MTGDTRLFAYASLATAALLALAACSPPEKKEPPPAAVTPTAAPAALTNPDSAKLAEHSPEQFQVQFETSKGNFTVTVHRAWSPNGADRFHYLVTNGFYDETRFFRVLPGFIAQFGLNGNPAVSAAWQERNIPDDPVKQGNKRGRLVYAKGGPNSRTTQLFINLVDNSGQLDAMGFPAFGEVTEGMAVVDSLYGGYGENPDQTQGMISTQGNAFLTANMPKLDYIKTARVIPAASRGLH